jgi:hypothetical protein
MTNKVARCKVCGSQWVLYGGSGVYDNAKGCQFCGAGSGNAPGEGSVKDAIQIIDETPDYSQGRKPRHRRRQ